MAGLPKLLHNVNTMTTYPGGYKRNQNNLYIELQVNNKTVINNKKETGQKWHPCESVKAKATAEFKGSATIPQKASRCLGKLDFLEELFHKKSIIPIFKHGGGDVMIWGYTSGSGQLAIIDRINGINSVLYQIILS